MARDKKQALDISVSLCYNGTGTKRRGMPQRPPPRKRPFGRAFAGVRDKVLYQLHFGADYSAGEYGWTTDGDAVKRSVEWQLKNLKTDYIDYAFIHCIDEEADLQKATDAGTIDYIKELKKQGVINHIGLSTHTPGIADMVMDMNIIGCHVHRP